MNLLHSRLAAATLSLLILAAAAVPAENSPRSFVVTRSSLCVTEGEIGAGPSDSLIVDAQKMRAYVNTWTAQSIEAEFTYVGPTAKESALGSGEIRRQFGLKLRAQDACNLVYAMWRIEPESRVVVSIKRNPGRARSSECGNRGYQNIKPRRASPVPALHPGDKHTLRAEMDRDNLRVFIDNREVWNGSLGPDAESLSGPVGSLRQCAAPARLASRRFVRGAPRLRALMQIGPRRVRLAAARPSSLLKAMCMPIAV
jgi:hypothetical protein